MYSSDRSLWLLVTIGSVPFVDGNTRLQKYSLLTSKIILDKQIAYDDWEANHFGGFSKQVMMDLQYLTKEELIQQEPIEHDSGQGHLRYSLTMKGKELIMEIIQSNNSIFEKIKTLVGFYFQRPLNDLITDTYTLYPEYTENSKIKSVVRDTLAARASDPRLRYVIPFITKQPDLSIIDSTETINDFPFNDENARLKISQMIGLSNIPKTNSTAIHKFSGILEKLFDDKELDAIELVRTIRGHS